MVTSTRNKEEIKEDDDDYFEHNLRFCHHNVNKGSILYFGSALLPFRRRFYLRRKGEAVADRPQLPLPNPHITQNKLDNKDKHHKQKQNK